MAGKLPPEFVEAIRYWEPRRIFFNVVLLAVIIASFILGYPGSREALRVSALLLLGILMLGANVAYCAVYVIDLYAEQYGYRRSRSVLRWLIYIFGTLMACGVILVWAIAFFS